MQILLFLSGLGLLLLAMRLMEQALSALGEGQLRNVLQSWTSTPHRGVVTGTLSTAIFQSSSLVGLMTMAFVGAGILPLRNAIGVILGSNLGTTFTGWLVTWIGFRLELDSFYAVCMGTGALLTVLTRAGSKLQQLGQFVTAFGLLLFGLVLMKDSIAFVVELVDVTRLQNLPVPVYFIFGMVLTALIQSSSATMMISLAAVSAGIIQWQSAAALVIGADLGTTSTVMLGSLGGSTIKRQFALVHFVFNLVTDLLALLALPLLLWLVTSVYSITDPLYGLVAVHSTFNFLGLLLFLPLTDQLRRLVEKLAPLPEHRKLQITQVTTEVPSASFMALEQDVRYLLTSCILLNAWRLQLLPEQMAARRLLLPETIESSYRELKDNENQLTDYLLDLGRREMDQEQAGRLAQLRVCIRDSLYSTKAVKDLEKDVRELAGTAATPQSAFLDGLLQVTETVYTNALKLLENTDDGTTNELGMMLQSIRDAHGRANTEIYELIDRQVLARDMASSALNVNRELLLAGHSLVNALEHCLLPGEQARTVSELLNLRN